EIADRRIVYKSPDALPAVPMDRRLLKLSVKQLLDNALKYSPVGTPVTLQTFHLNGTVGLEVTDAGNGIPQDEQLRLFERFYRSSSVQDQIPGSGLGLSIARRILEAHKGTLALKSRPGETSFRLALPVNGEEEKHRAQERSSGSTTNPRSDALCARHSPPKAMKWMTPGMA